MIEKINTKKYQIISTANNLVNKYLNEVLLSKNMPVYFEIGIGIGATVLNVSKILNNKGMIYIFSRKKDCEELKYDLNKLGFTNINDEWCSPDNAHSGYHFEIATAILEKKLPQFDLCYLDGGHVFHLDAPTTCMIKELCKNGGYIIFDDYDWSLNSSPTLNPSVRPQTAIEYDAKQINAQHIKMICSLFMDTDNRFQKMPDSSKSVVVYRKTTNG